jgi:copper homeostasis protein
MVGVEVCAYSLESCLAAQNAGATRIELCGGFFEGGTSPSGGLLQIVKEQINIPISVMIRPRGGDFLYNNSEIEVIKAEIALVKKLGFSGVVFGFLQKNGSVNAVLTEKMAQLAYPMQCTFHRAIDMTPNLEEAVSTIKNTGCFRILTSGGKNKAIDGIITIENMVKMANNKIEIMAGSGINIGNVVNFLEIGINAVHLSATNKRQSEMEYKKEGINMGGFGEVNEYETAFADQKIIEGIVAITKRN